MMDHLDEARHVIQDEINALQAMSDRLGESFGRAAEL
ncbi:unnamed protein product, partial [marine sediment metagenome]